jgi:hypothetical protein
MKTQVISCLELKNMQLDEDTGLQMELREASGYKYV